MSSEHTISIATASGDGARGDGRVSMPVDELMASNGLVTGQSGAEPADSVRRLAESLLDAGETLFVVDPAGDFDALTDHSAVLHVGGNRNCDVQVEPSAVDRVASLALDGSTSIVLDLTAFDASAADDVLGKLTDELVNTRRERRADLLMVVHECHRWLAGSGPATRTGENLVQLGGRRHDGVGIVGITDQPADVREDVRSGVDWVLAHRLTWQEDVRALEGMLDRHHVDALGSLDDEEAIYNAGWEGSARRITIGSEASRSGPASAASTATEESDDLFAGLPEARAPESDGEDPSSQSTTNHDGEAAALRDELAEMENRVAALEAKLEARESIEDVADRIADAITEGLRDAGVQPNTASTEQSTTETSQPPAEANPTTDPSNDETRTGDSSETSDDADADGPGGFGDVFGMFDDDGNADSSDTASAGSSSSPGSDTAEAGSASIGDDSTTATDSGSTPSTNGVTGTDASPAPSSNDADDGGMSFEPIDFGFDDRSADIDSTVPDDFGSPSRHGSSGRTIPRYLRKIVRSLEEMDATTRRMLAYYIEQGTESPMDAHYSAGGGGDRTRAYAHNRRLRTNGLIEHVGKGKYAPRLREYVVDEAGHSVPEHELDRAVDVIRQTVEEA